MQWTIRAPWVAAMPRWASVRTILCHRAHAQSPKSESWNRSLPCREEAQKSQKVVFLLLFTARWIRLSRRHRGTEAGSRGPLMTRTIPSRTALSRSRSSPCLRDSVRTILEILRLPPRIVKPPNTNFLPSATQRLLSPSPNMSAIRLERIRGLFKQECS